MQQHPQEYPYPYTKCLGGRGQIYLQDCLIPLARHFGKAEFAYCDMESVLAGGCLTARKMFSQMKEAGFIIKMQQSADSKNILYALHPEVFRIVEERTPPLPTTTRIVDSKLPLMQYTGQPIPHML